MGVETTIAAAGLFDTGIGYHQGRMLAGVTVEERARYETLRHPQRARQYLASRWLLRRHLAGELDMEPIDVPLQFNTHGPPTLPGMPDCHIGLSHSRALCLCVLSRGPHAGCDVEHHRSGRRLNELAHAYFHPREAAELDTSGQQTRRLTDFYHLWTLKEAGRKALAQGIADGLQTPAFTLRPVFRCLHPPDTACWTFSACELARTSERYSLAIAVRARTPSGVVTIYEYAADHARQPLDTRRDTATVADPAENR